jgi:hypothetical protein
VRRRRLRRAWELDLEQAVAAWRAALADVAAVDHRSMIAPQASNPPGETRGALRVR